MTALLVYREQDPIGKLWLDPEGRFVFQYERKWLHRADNFPISLSLPLQEEPFERDHSRHFFSNLLPEGDVRRLIAAKLGISPGNDFKLLEAIGGDCAGALTLLPEELPVSEEGRYRPLPPEELDRIIESMPRRPLLAAENGVRLSLAGAQNKLPVHHENEEVFLPEGSFASSYILKPQIPHIDDSVFNEVYCMSLAYHMEMQVAAPVKLRFTGKNWYCLIQRYDRLIQSGKRIRRLHQEDFCQALGIKADRKYESEQGPSFLNCFRLLEAKSSRPAADKKSLIQWAIFNFVIGNADAHGKNISLLISEDGIRLAPFYDLMSTMIYPNLSAKMAMKIGGKYEPDNIFRRHWEQFAGEAGVKSDFVLLMLREMVNALPEHAEALFNKKREFSESPAIAKIHTFIQDRCAFVKKYALEEKD